MNAKHLPSPNSFLRLVTREELEAPSGATTLTEYFHGHYLPVVLRGERDVKPPTVLQYETLLRWWCQFTGNPPLEDITKSTLATFAADLRTKATYKRGLTGKERPLSLTTVHKLTRLTRSMLNSAHEEGVITKKVRFALRAPAVQRKEAFSLEQAQAVIAALSESRLPRGGSIPSTAAWWRGLLALLFYTGCRVGAALQFRKSFLRVQRRELWLHIPGAVNEKTGKAIDLPVHPCLAAALQPLPEVCFPIARGSGRGNWRAHEIVGSRRNLEEEHKRLQAVAGIDRPIGFHAWRRTHADELSLVGMNHALELSRRSLQHNSADTTRTSYSDPLLIAVMRLPWLWQRHPEERSDDPRQMRLFEN